MTQDEDQLTPEEIEISNKYLRYIHVFLLTLNWAFLFGLIYLGMHHYNPYIVIPLSGVVWFIIRFSKRYVLKLSDRLDEDGLANIDEPDDEYQATKADPDEVILDTSPKKERISIDSLSIKHYLVMALMTLIPGTLWYWVGRGISKFIN